MQTKTKVIIVSVALLTSFAIGRYTTPVQIKTETKIVEVEKKVDDTKKDADKHKTTTTTTTKNPDGTEVTTTTTHEDSAVHTHEHDTDSAATTTDTVKEVTRSSSPVTLSLLAGVPFTGTPNVIYGGSVTKPVLGPVTVGVWGMSNSTGGASIGLTF